MRKLLSIMVLSMLVSTMYAASKVEVYYFHYTRRCTTCQAVEDVTKKIISENYAKLYKSAVIVFKSVNLDEDKNKALATKCKAAGQSLLVISNGKRVDLTDQAFMNAVNRPEKLKQVLKETIDPLL